MKGRRQEQRHEQSSASLPKFLARMRFWSLLFIITLLSGCTHLEITDCPEGSVLGSDELCIDSSYYRMILDDKPAVAARFLPHAVMLAIAISVG